MNHSVRAVGHFVCVDREGSRPHTKTRKREKKRTRFLKPVNQMKQEKSLICFSSFSNEKRLFHFVRWNQFAVWFPNLEKTMRDCQAVFEAVWLSAISLWWSWWLPKLIEASEVKGQ